MGVENKLKDRVSDAVVRSYYKPWHKRMSGKISLVILATILLIVVYFGFKVGIASYHVSQGEIYNTELGIWLTPEASLANLELAADLLTDDDPWLGAEQPLVQVIAFESFACPFCKSDQETLDKVVGIFGPLLRLTIKDFPTEGIHPGVFEAHLAAACANEQGVYWPYRKLLFENQGEFDIKNLKLFAKNLGISISQFDQCLDDEKYATEVRQDYSEGVDLGTSGTPSYLVNGVLVEGSQPFEFWEAVISHIITKGEA